MLKKLLVILGVLSLVVFLGVGCGTDEAEGTEEEGAARIAIATTGSGGGAYITGGAIAGVLNPLQDVFELSSMVTAGFGENPILVDSGDVELGMMMEAAIEDAYLGQGDFEEPHDNIRRLFTYNIFIAHLIVRDDSGIETWEDLRGESINLGVPAQITRDYNELLFEQALGYDLQADIDMNELSTGDGFDALRDGVIDAASNLTVHQQGSLVELATAIDIRFLDMDDNLFEKFNEAAGGTLLRHNVPAGTYPGQETDNPTWAAGSTIIANKDVDDDVVYEFTKLFWEELERLQEEDSSFEGLNLEDHALSETEVPLHPGAERYFQEQGLLD